MAENEELFIDIEDEPRLFLEKEEGETRIFRYNHCPHLGLVCPDPQILYLPCLPMKAFAPNSEEFFPMVRENDLIIVSYDSQNKISQRYTHKAERFKLDSDFHMITRVKQIAPDVTGTPMFIAEADM